MCSKTLLLAVSALAVISTFSSVIHTTAQEHPTYYPAVPYYPLPINIPIPYYPIDPFAFNAPADEKPVAMPYWYHQGRQGCPLTPTTCNAFCVALQKTSGSCGGVFGWKCICV